MTKQDFELIAKAIRTMPAVTTRDHVAETLAHALQSTNPRFDTDRFITASAGDPLAKKMEALGFRSLKRK